MADPVRHEKAIVERVVSNVRVALLLSSRTGTYRLRIGLLGVNVGTKRYEAHAAYHAVIQLLDRGIITTPQST